MKIITTASTLAFVLTSCQATTHLKPVISEARVTTGSSPLPSAPSNLSSSSLSSEPTETPESLAPSPLSSISATESDSMAYTSTGSDSYTPLTQPPTTAPTESIDLGLKVTPEPTPLLATAPIQLEGDVSDYGDSVGELAWGLRESLTLGASAAPTIRTTSSFFCTLMVLLGTELALVRRP